MAAIDEAISTVGIDLSVLKLNLKFLIILHWRGR
jgi:hypothetical protein